MRPTLRQICARPEKRHCDARRARGPDESVSLTVGNGGIPRVVMMTTPNEIAVPGVGDAARVLDQATTPRRLRAWSRPVSPRRSLELVPHV